MLRSTVILTVRLRMGIAVAFVLTSAVEINERRDSVHARLGSWRLIGITTVFSLALSMRIDDVYYQLFAQL